MHISSSQVDVGPEVSVHGRSLRALVLGLCILSFVAMVFVWIAAKWRASWAPFNEISFNASVWRSQRTIKEKEKRAKMAGDLIRHYLKRSMTEKDVASLLGSPDYQPSLAGFAPIDR